MGSCVIYFPIPIDKGFIDVYSLKHQFYKDIFLVLKLNIYRTIIIV